VIDRGELEEYIWELFEQRKTVNRERRELHAEYSRTVYDGMEIPNGCMHEPKSPGEWYAEQVNGALEVGFDLPEGWVEENDNRAFFVLDEGIEPVEVFFNDEGKRKPYTPPPVDFVELLTELLLEYTWSEVRLTDDYAAMVTDAALTESETDGMARVILTVEWESI
jgi:hypothetical protein